VIETTAGDVRYAVRLLARAPAWTLVAILSLALGIAANATVFSLVDAVLLNPFPYRDPEGLVLLWGSKSGDVTRGISGADLADWRRQSRALEDIDAFLGNQSYGVDDGDGPKIKGACIGARVLPMLGAEPRLGRNFTAGEATYGAAPVVMLSDGLWRSRFAGDPSAIGRTIRLNGHVHEVIGVMPAGFFFPDTDARLWTAAPCGVRDFESRSSVTLNAIGRLRPGVTPLQGQNDLDLINIRLARAYPDTNKGRTTGVFPLRYIVIGKYERALWMLLAGVGLVLLIACLNLVHLQLARGVERETELAVRLAAGASRGRIVRQLLTESFVLAAIAGALGILLAWFGVKAIHAFAITDIPRMEYAKLDARIVVFAAALSIAAALISGVWPALKHSRLQAGETLKLGASATPARSRTQLRDLLVITEIATAIAVLIASGLVVRSFVHLSRADWGFDPERLLMLDVRLPQPLWRARDRAGEEQLSKLLRDRIRLVPDVTSVAVSYNAPIRWSAWTGAPVIASSKTDPVNGGIWTVGAGYLSTIGVPFFAGRDFTDADDAAATRVAVVSRAFAQDAWPAGNALGQRIQIFGLRMQDGKPLPEVQEAMRQRRRIPFNAKLYEPLDGVSWEVIGLVADVRMFSLQIVGNPAVYISIPQQPKSNWFAGTSNLKILVRTAGEPGDAAARIRAEILGAHPDLAIEEVVPMGELVAQSIGGRGSNKLMLVVASAFGVLALLFVTIGIYGVFAHNVSERLREIGIRIALGAARGDIVRLLMAHGGRLIGFGLALGLTSAWALTRGMQALLFQVNATDAATYAGAVAVLIAAAVAACLLPLRRAARFDPLTLFKA
jgi:predicted permease